MAVVAVLWWRKAATALVQDTQGGRAGVAREISGAGHSVNDRKWARARVRARARARARVRVRVRARARARARATVGGGVRVRVRVTSTALP